MQTQAQGKAPGQMQPAGQGSTGGGPEHLDPGVQTPLGTEVSQISSGTQSLSVEQTAPWSRHCPEVRITARLSSAHCTTAGRHSESGLLHRPPASQSRSGLHDAAETAASATKRTSAAKPLRMSSS